MEVENKHKNKYGIVFSIITVLATMAIVGVWNRYIFDEKNLIFLFMILLCSAVLVVRYPIPKDLIFSDITFSVVIFVVYMYIRMYDENALEHLAYYGILRSNGFLEILNQLLYYGVFLISALLYYGKGFSITVWMVIVAYAIAFIGKNTVGHQVSNILHNISPGLRIFSLLPFILLQKFRYKSFMYFVPSAISLFCILWIFVVRARGPLMALMVFYGCIYIWPVITRKRLVYLGFFCAVLIVVISSKVMYVSIISNKQQTYGNMQKISYKIFKKDISTRFDIWNELWLHISDRLVFGYGTEMKSGSIVESEKFWRRTGLSSHSTYFELMLRFGLVGLVLYFFMLFNIWKGFWYGRREWVVRVAGSFLISTLICMATAEFFMFVSPLTNGFGWIVLGIGAGACLKAKREQHYYSLASADYKQNLKFLGGK